MMRALRGSKPSSQKDHHLSFEVNREDLAWSAGIFEGEGCFTKSGHTYCAVLSMSDKDVVDKFDSVFQFPAVRSVEDRSKRGRKTMYVWRLNQKEYVQAFIAMIWPWLVSLGEDRRKPRAKEALEWINRDRRNGTTIKLNWDQVREIRRRADEPRSVLARDFEIHESAISMIITGRVWSDPNYNPPEPNYKPSARLDWPQVREIRRRYTKGNRWHPGNAEDLASEFGVTRQCIGAIVNGRRWKE